MRKFRIALDWTPNSNHTVRYYLVLKTVNEIILLRRGSMLQKEWVGTLKLAWMSRFYLLRANTRLSKAKSSFDLTPLTSLTYTSIFVEKHQLVKLLKEELTFALRRVNQSSAVGQPIRIVLDL